MTSPPTTLIGCIESGDLEQQCVLLLQSLRKFGGSMSSVPVRLYRCRGGHPLNRGIVDTLLSLGAEVFDRPKANPYPWWPHYNKSAAMRMAVEEVDTEYLTFLDSDILISGDFSDVVPEDADFAACPEAVIVATTGPDHENEPYWIACSERMGIGLDRLGWVDSVPEGVRIRRYWNSGVFSLRRESRIAFDWDQACRQLHESQIASPRYRAFFTDQVALAFAVSQTDRTKTLPIELNCQVNTLNRDFTDPSAIPNAIIVHYHKSMRPEGFQQLLEDLSGNSQPLASMVQQHGPLRSAPRTLHHRIRDRWVRKTRSIRKNRFFERLASAKTV
ncbi:glycosyltransferase family 2 protein [Roseiconus nitratireducens]|uniref:Glycosyltransferase family 2 protein n=1 Tax=Roseiconus nitratireducens TaxID=2605748 RepID=A0A5M6DIT1_9BACT|nr:glycosyltransferase family A protein [Roseiconus nitratireducens]KAA5546132.1 glycosyltransferase family 2 protein [Roseiconus nitratireducens]